MNAPKQSIFNALGPAFDATLVKLMKEWQVPGVCLAVVMSTREGTFEECTRSYGYQDGVFAVSANVSTQSHCRCWANVLQTLFPIASLSKLFSVIAVGHALKKAGQTKGYHTPIKEILSDFQLTDPIATQQCTVADICSHMTGMPAYTFAYNTGASDMNVVCLLLMCLLETNIQL